MLGIGDARNNLKTRKILGGFHDRVYPEYCMEDRGTDTTQRYYPDNSVAFHSSDSRQLYFPECYSTPCVRNKHHRA